mmetsp:Transcript_22015/g.61105  ORF Transcript_22015/g.61105 Transcript_22015/m.61105 type:complete len:375 (-) Transcript_22015:470-1594(-)
MRSATIRLHLLVILLATAAHHGRARELNGWGGRCSFRGIWFDDGDYLEGDSQRCRCDDGRWTDCRDLNGCRRQQWPPSNDCSYECPENSCVKSGHVYVDDRNDCECKPGYDWSSGRCVQESSSSSPPWNGGGGGGGKACLYYSGGRIKAFPHGSWRDNQCQCQDGDWRCGPVNPPTGPSGCFWQGGSFPHGSWRPDNRCQCIDGDWRCQPPPPSDDCFWQGSSFQPGSWRDSCQCVSGSWKCAPDPPSPDGQPGCIDDLSLPFGLENCICDGASVGQVAGLAACGRVATECEDSINSFSRPQQNPLVEAVQRVCDSFSFDGCKSASNIAKFENPGCAQLLQFGSSKCSRNRANEIFDQSVQLSCEPLCRNCARP